MSVQDNVLLKNIAGIVAGIGIFLFAITFLAWGMSPVAHAETSQELIDERIKPLGRVSVGQPAAAEGESAEGAAADPKQTYTEACFACHGTGAAGAPKLGDKAAWKVRIAQGKDTLYSHALQGFKGMPAKGGRADLSEATVKAVVDYMVSESE